MKKLFKTALLLLLCFALSLSLVACSKDVGSSNVWENANYTENTEIGEGSKTISLSVEAKEKTVVFTIHTDEKTLGDALLKLDLISGEQGNYGIYIKSVNGISADYDVDGAYWGFFKEGEMMSVGVDFAEIKDGDKYELVYSE
ncbi:MAG: DUF4430 domain-containing protein [Clostridia bacterium]|nr:DUF4430 domain-containing protein [Clostridia bacterium]